MNPSGTSRAILYAEDSEDDAFFLQRAYRLAKIAHPLQIVPDGALVLRYLEGDGAFANRAHHPFPHLVLLDMKMPCMGGLEVLELIRQRPEWTNLAVCLLTSSNQPRDIDRACELGANAYVVKPANADRLRSILIELDRLACEAPTGAGWEFAGNQCSALNKKNRHPQG